MLIRGNCFMISIFFWLIVCLIRKGCGTIGIDVTRFWLHQLKIVNEEVFLGQTKLPTPIFSLNTIHKQCRNNQHKWRVKKQFTMHLRRHTWVQRINGSFMRSGLTRYSAASSRKHLTTTENIVSVRHHCTIASVRIPSLLAWHRNQLTNYGCFRRLPIEKINL